MRKELPILFSTEMVRAILDGRKTQTRRVINPRNPISMAIMINMNLSIELEQAKKELARCFSPYGQSGDLLWVREKFFYGHFSEDTTICDDPNCGHWDYEYFANTRDKRPGGVSESWCYNEYGPNTECYPRWRPSIHMPKEAARIWLEVTDVRVERLRDITPEDAISEGIKHGVSGNSTFYWHGNSKGTSLKAVNAFQSLWESINGPESWEQNPWVWVIKSKILSTTGKPEGL